MLSGMRFGNWYKGNVHLVEGSARGGVVPDECSSTAAASC